MLIVGAVALLHQGAAIGAAPELLGASEKSVGRILGDGQALEGVLFNEESSESHSGGIGSTHAYRARVGYIGGRCCYAFFMKKTGESFNPAEVMGLLYLCADRAEWRAVDVGDGSGAVGGALIHRPTSSKGGAAGQTYLAILDADPGKLIVYSPEWRPDFDRELWITPDEAPVHSKTDRLPVIEKGGAINEVARQADPQLLGKGGRISSSKGGRTSSSKGGVISIPKGGWTSSSKGGGTSDSKGRPISSSKGVPVDGKQGIYLPQEDKVIPTKSGKGQNASKVGKDKKTSKSDKRKRRGKAEPKPIPTGK